MSTSVVLASAFVLSFVALLVFIWSQRNGLFDRDSRGAQVIFGKDAIGRAEEPAVTRATAQALQEHVNNATGKVAEAADPEDLQTRAAADASSAPVVFFMFCSAFGWLLLATLAGLIASYKLHEPDFLANYAWLTFGRIRTIHLNAVAYGWAPMAGLGIAMFVLPRLFGRTLLGGRFAILGASLWNAALISGIASIAVGINDGLEWLEIPWQVDVLFILSGVLLAVPLVLTLAKRKVEHLYVSAWYMACALFWFPVMFVVANAPALHRGVEQATMNWWFAHNVLGLFYTPLALAATYYFLPKVIGRPVQSYNLSLIGFWGLAFFYGQVGGHHLIGGPVPDWLITLSIVQSVMMALPVFAFTVNMYQTLKGYLRSLLYSPTLRFIGLGGLMYTASSLQGSFEALRSVNAVTHFTHYTVAHAHLGLYGFVTMVYFGAMYFIVPRITQREWPYQRLITAHFWLVTVGVAIYVTALSIGGWLQGEAMLDAKRPFMDSVALTLPYLKLRTIGGALMGLGHLVFAVHFACMIFDFGPRRAGATLLRQMPAEAS